MVLNVRKMRGPSEITKLGNHIYRKEEETRNIDKSRTHLNEELVKLHSDKENLNGFVEKRLREVLPFQKRKIRKDAVKAFAVVLSYGQEKMPETFDLDKWKEKSVDFLQDFFGKENVGSVVLHMDEHTPHIHAFVTPIVDDHFNSKSYFGWKGDISTWHEKYYEYVKELGFEAPVHGTRAKSESIAKFYEMLNSHEEDRLPDVRDGETAGEYHDRAQEYHGKAVAVYEYNKQDHEKDKKRVKALEKTNRTLFEENKELRETVEEYRKADKKVKQSRRELETLAVRDKVKEIEDEVGMKLGDIKENAILYKSETAALEYAGDSKEHKKLAARFEVVKEELLTVYKEEVLDKECELEPEEEH